MEALWKATDPKKWREALSQYAEVIERQGVAKLPDRERWYRSELPGLISARQPRHVTLPELIRLTEWKMSRGTWRAPNLVLVKGNDAGVVRELSGAALAQVPHPTAPIRALAELAGVGPATASAVLAAAEPAAYPFFDELVAGQVAGLGNVAFTLGYYARYAEAVRARSAQLGSDWTAGMVEQALWANVGGKAGVH